MTRRSLADEWADDWRRRLERRFRREPSLHGLLEQERRDVMRAVQSEQGAIEIYDTETEHLRRTIHATP